MTTAPPGADHRTGTVQVEARPGVEHDDVAAAVARRVRACPDVFRLLPVLGSRHDVGVRIDPDAVVVAVVGRYGPTIAELAAQVRAAVLLAAPTAPRIDVRIEDLEVDVPAWAGVS